MPESFTPMKLVEKVMLKKFNGDETDPNNCTEVIVTIDGVVVEHWRKLIVVNGDQMTDKWTEANPDDAKAELLFATQDWTRSEQAARDEAFRTGDAVMRSQNG